MTRPPLGAIAIVLHDGHALMVQRAHEPDAGLWGYPGGHVELGETVAEAAARELAEETGVRGAPGPVLGTLDLIQRDDAGALISHFFLVAVRCSYLGGEPTAADDALDCRWVPFADIRAGRLPMSDHVAHVLDLAGAD